MRFQSFEEMLSYWAERKENGPALLFDERGKNSWTYAELLRRVRERTEELRAGGKTCLGVLADGSRDCVVEIFAAVQAGTALDVSWDAAANAERYRGTVASAAIVRYPSTIQRG